MSGRIRQTGHMTREPPTDPIVGASKSLVEGQWQWPVHGLRHPPVGDTCGWYIWTGEFSTDEDFFKPWHTSHLIRRVPDVERPLGLPPGTRFLAAPGHEDIWDDPTLL
jgi:hypothetical protein